MVVAGSAGVADLHACHRRLGQFDNLSQALVRDEKPRARDACLAVVLEAMFSATGTAFSKSASSRRIVGDLPPSARLTRFIVSSA